LIFDYFKFRIRFAFVTVNVEIEGYELYSLKKPVSEIQKKMRTFKGKDFKADKAWGAIDIANINGVTTRLHWTDKPYKWHVNDGEEVFAVLDGAVEMRYRENGDEKRIRLDAGDIFFAEIGCEHVAHPLGEARILVVEKEGSV
jgi:mannose-6-phosphate isomerase-like protein (cupin superfamily)